MVEIKNKKRNVIQCHPDLIKILDTQDEQIKEYTWGVVKKLGYYEKTEILAKKINSGKID